MAKESAYFTVGGISGKHDVKEIKRGLDTLPGVLSVSVGGGRVAVDYTPVKFVKKPAGARPGMVVYTTYQTAVVEPKKP